MTVPESSYERDVLSFVNLAIEEGEAFLKTQQGYDKISQSIDAIFAKDSLFLNSGLSTTSVNFMAKIVTDLSAGLTDVRPFWEYRTANHSFDRQIEIYSRLGEHWWFQRQGDMRFVDAIKYVSAAGTAFLHVTWNPEIRDIQLLIEDPRDVIPIRPTSTMQLQDCAGVVIRREHTVNYIRQMYSKADETKIRAEQDGSQTQMLSNTRYGRLLEKLGSPFFNWMQSNKTALQVPKIPTCTLYTTYLKDNSLNESKAPRYMGEWHLGPSKKRGFLAKIVGSTSEETPGFCRECEEGKFPHPVTNWSYLVGPGEPLYPNGRMIVSTNYGVLYDGPSPYWHGCVIPFPLVKLTLDPYPWSWFGRAVCWDLLPLQNSINKAVRVWEDWLEKLARPDVIADKNSVSQAELKKIDTRKAGLKVRQNPMAGKGVIISPPPPLPQDFWKGLDFLITTCKELSGVADTQSLMRLNQMPSSDTIEQIMATLSPSNRLRSRIIEAAVREFATILAYDFTQFYTLPMRLTIMGARGVTKQDFDFDPNTFIPDYVNPEDLDPQTGQPTGEAMRRGPRPRFIRAREILRQLEAHISPDSLLESSNVTEKMLYVQLYRMGALDIWTMLDKLKIPNIGEAPPGNIIQRLAAQMEAGIVPEVSPVGRKASGQQEPKMKSSGAISESS